MCLEFKGLDLTFGDRSFSELARFGFINTDSKVMEHPEEPEECPS